MAALRGADSLLADARCGLTDTALCRAWGKRRRDLRDRIHALLYP